jgi:hypothetical protein
VDIRSFITGSETILYTRETLVLGFCCIVLRHSSVEQMMIQITPVGFAVLTRKTFS